MKKIDVICKKCNKQEKTESRYSSLKHYFCKECKDNKKQFYDSFPGNYVKCNFCNKDYLFISKSHIWMCSEHTMTYEQYVEKFGRQSVWSEKYSHLMTQKSIEAAKNQEVKEKIIASNKRYFETHKEEVLKRTEKMRNSPKRLKNLLENYENMSEEEHQTRVEASKKSWCDEEKRKNRMKSLKISEKAIIARKNNWKKCLSTVQPIVSKPARQLYEYLKSKNYNVELEYPIRFYHLDIALSEYKICTEVDGDYWHGNPLMYETLSEKQIARQNSDKRKSTYLTNKGWVVLRFWQSELIQKGYDQVTNAIDHIISQRKGTTC